MTQDIKQRVEEAYNAAVALAGKQYITVTFEVEGIKYTSYPTRLGRRIKELSSREEKLVECARN